MGCATSSTPGCVHERRSRRRPAARDRGPQHRVSHPQRHGLAAPDRESGSGKSVTAYAVMGILDTAARVTQGSIVFGGLELLTAERKVLDEVRGREVAIIFQNPRTALNPIRPIGLQIADILL